MSGFFKFLAVILAIAVIFALPAALLMQSAGRLLFSPSSIVDLLNENLLNSEVMASLAEYTFQHMEPKEDATSQYGQLGMEGMKQLDHDQWVEIIDLIAPPELISSTMEQILVGYYSWVLGNKAELAIWVDMAPWKQTLGKNFTFVAEMVMAELPTCSSGELQRYALAAANPEAEIPLCKPPEPYYSDLLNNASHAVPDELAAMEDRVNLLADSEMTAAEWREAKDGMLAMQAASQVGWVGVLFIFVMIIPLGARSWTGVLKWAGWPILLAGGFLLVIALAFYAPGRAAGGAAAFADSDVPPVLHEPMQQLFKSIFEYLARPLLLQSIAMIVLGTAGIGTAALMDYRHKAFENENSTMPRQDVSSNDQSTILFDEIATEQRPLPPEEPPAKAEEGHTDESKPSGMFG